MSDQLTCQDDRSGAGVAAPFTAQEQRPGLAALRYRVGTHASFKEAMKGSIFTKLPLLRTREQSDPSIALMDAGAAMLDVLTFYQERIANEGFLRTANERRSVLELSRAIGYEINPGVAATAYLAVTVEETGGSGVAWVEKGTKIQSVPGPGEKAQLFETVEEKREVRAAWNLLKVKATQKQEIYYDQKQLFLDGSDLRLQPGDVIVVVGKERKGDFLSERWDARVLTEVTIGREEGWTAVRWAEGLGHVSYQDLRVDPSQDNPEVHVFRQRASLFGHNAPDARTLEKSIGNTTVINGSEWVDFCSERPGPEKPWLDRHPRQIDVSAAYPRILKNTWLLMARAWHPPQTEPSGSKSHPRNDFSQLYWIESVSLGSRCDFAVSSEITRIIVDKKQDLNQFGLRETAVYAQSEQLKLAEIPMTAPVTGSVIELSQVPKGLYKGQRLAVWGKEIVTEKEISEIVAVTGVNGATLWLDPPLSHNYQANTLCLSGNVVKANHGETRQELLGSGDGSRRFQRFLLKQVPVTYVAAATASGGQSTLEIRVDEVLWEETPSLFGHDGKARVYTARFDDEGRVTVQFGDGRTGARLPTGVDNVTARYRIGTGMDGMLQPNQLSLLVTRPLGVRGVTNPAASEGANDRESRDEARHNAPFTVCTLERIVSLRDYEIFARRFSGIGKAQAVWLHDARRRFVHLTVVAADGDPVREGTDLFNNLRQSILQYGLPRQEFLIQSVAPLTFGLQAKLRVKQGYLQHKVFAAVRSALAERFCFQRRAFCEPVRSCEVIALIQKVPGVEMVDLDFLSQGGNHLLELVPRCAYRNPKDGRIHPSQMLVIDPKGIELVELKKGQNA